MGCKPKTTKSRCKLCKRLNGSSDRKKYKEYMANNLENIGREQFFWHYPKSSLPIRDITQKTEPHIEHPIGAENYLRTCIQASIRGFCHSSEKYLFLRTTCKNREVGNGNFFGKRFVVGYITKKGYMRMGEDHLTVIGETYMVPFDKELEYERIRLKRSRGMHRFNEEVTERLLKQIHCHRNIISDYIKEMVEKEKEEKRGGYDLPIDKECLKERCEFRDDCRRRRLQ